MSMKKTIAFNNIINNVQDINTNSLLLLNSGLTKIIKANVMGGNIHFLIFVFQSLLLLHQMWEDITPVQPAS